MRSFVLVPMMLVACGENPADHTPAAEVVPANAAPAPAPEAGPAPSNDAPALAEGQSRLGGHIHFVGSNVRSSHTCRFDKWNGVMTPGEGGAVEALKLEFTADVNSVFCDWETKPDGVPKLEKHLRSDDFFHAEAHPEARFVSTTIEPAEGGDYKVTGDFSLRGVTNTISFPAKIDMSEGKLNAHARFDINRSDWGVEYKGAADNLIREEVVLDIKLEES